MRIRRDQFKKFFQSSLFIILILALAKLVLHLATAVNYGYFVDELYTIACGEHLSFGYVDIPPMAPFLSKISGLLFGYSLFSIHIFPAVSGAFLIFFAGLFVKELGGGRLAVFLTCISALAAAAWLIFNSMLAYDNFDQIFTLVFLFILLKLIRKDNPKLFIALGIIGGICLLTKLTIAFIAVSLAAALVITKQRRYFASPWPWLGSVIAMLIFLPYLFWQNAHQWPFLEYMNSYSKYGTYHANPLEYLGMITLMMNPLALPLWLAGLYYFLIDKEGRKYSVFGLMPVFLFILLFIILKAKAYMILTCFIPLMAGGSILLERVFANRKWIWLKSVYIFLVLAEGIILLPVSLPVLKPGDLVNYYKYFGSFIGQVKTENSPEAVFPQTTADRFGWDELVKDIAAVYNSLPEEDRNKCMIFCGNYGAAGAVDLLGGQYGLPKAVSAHLSYYIWGPGNNTGEIAVTAGVRSGDLTGFYSEVVPVKDYYNKYTMPRNNIPIYLCRKPKMTIKDAWKHIKHY